VISQSRTMSKLHAYAEYGAENSAEAPLCHFEAFTKEMFDAEESRDMLRVHRVKEMLAESEARISAKAAELYDRDYHSACQRLVDLLGQISNDHGIETSLGTAMDSEVVRDFIRIVQPIPPKVLSGGLSSLTKFALAKMQRSSPEKALERAQEYVALCIERDELSEDAVGRQIETQFRARTCLSYEMHKKWLANSDHKPIRATFMQSSTEMSSVFRVSSHNVMERTFNGILAYVSNMPFIRGKKGMSTKLARWCLRDEVCREQTSQVVDFVNRELLLKEACDAVALQELSPGVIAALREHCASTTGPRRLWLHASEPPQVPPQGDECWAMTCLVSRHPFEALPDVTVDTRQPSKVVTRRFATVHVPSHRVLLSSVHVRHPIETKKAKEGPVVDQSELNKGNVIEALSQLAGAPSYLAPESRKLVLGVLAVGDFNGPLTTLRLQEVKLDCVDHDAIVGSAEVPKRNFTGIIAAAPAEPTVPPPLSLPIDGAVWLPSALQREALDKPLGQGTADSRFACAPSSFQLECGVVA